MIAFLTKSFLDKYLIRIWKTITNITKVLTATSNLRKNSAEAKGIIPDPTILLAVISIRSHKIVVLTLMSKNFLKDTF